MYTCRNHVVTEWFTNSKKSEFKAIICTSQHRSSFPLFISLKKSKYLGPRRIKTLSISVNKKIAPSSYSTVTWVYSNSLWWQRVRQGPSSPKMASTISPIIWPKRTDPNKHCKCDKTKNCRDCYLPARDS